MNPTQQFGTVVTATERFRLDEAAMLIAQHAHPDINVDEQIARLDDLADSVRAPTLDGVRQFLFRDFGLMGNRDDYYDPENSFLDSVMTRRQGIPISLAVLTLEVSRRIAVPVYGVSMPGHFLVGDRVDPELYIDVFNGGVELRPDDCAAIYESLGGHAPFDPATMLAEVTGDRIIERILANLTSIYTHRGDARSLLWVLRLRTLLPNRPLGALQDFAEAVTDTGRFGEAGAAWDELGDELEAAQADPTEARLRARQQWARLN